jgi:hypothetical protein
MKKFQDLIEASIQGLYPQQIDAEPDPLNPEDYLTEPAVLKMRQSGYQLQSVTVGDDGKKIAILVKDSGSGGKDVKHIVLEGKYATSAGSWIKSIIKSYPQMKISDYEVIDEVNLWEITWNHKPFMIVTADASEIQVTIHPQGIIKNARKAIKKIGLYKKIRNLEDLRDALIIGIEALPKSEIPEEYR